MPTSANGLFSGSRCQIFTTLGEDTSLSVASLPRSSPRRSAHPDFRIPRKISSYGPAYTCLQIICYVRRAQCWTVVEHRIYIRSTSNPSFFPRSRFENLKIRAESFDLMSVVRLTRKLQHTAEKKVTIHKNLSKTIDEAIHETVTVLSAWIWFWSCSKPKTHLGDSLRFSEAATFSWRTITNRTNYCDFQTNVRFSCFAHEKYSSTRLGPQVRHTFYSWSLKFVAWISILNRNSSPWNSWMCDHPFTLKKGWNH